MLLQCDPRGDFTCNDGNCVDLSGRCDEIYNCFDMSDEENCKMVEVRPNRMIPIINADNNEITHLVIYGIRYR